ncbi:MAG: hypothetical protein ACI4TX_03110, partial [Christensenellales bacterium]
TTALDEFCENTDIYKCNAERFKKIVNSVEAKTITPDKIAGIVLKALRAKKCKYVYNINRNIWLRVLNILPKRLQNYIIKKILQP